MKFITKNWDKLLDIEFSKNLAKKPANGGIPANENINIVMTTE